MVNKQRMESKNAKIDDVEYVIVVVLKDQKWITERYVRFTAVYIYENTGSNS